LLNIGIERKTTFILNLSNSNLISLIYDASASCRFIAHYTDENKDGVPIILMRDLLAKAERYVRGKVNQVKTHYDRYILNSIMSPMHITPFTSIDLIPKTLYLSELWLKITGNVVLSLIIRIN